MKKILVIFSGLHFPYHSLDYAINLAKKSNALVTGVFLKINSERQEYPFINDLSLTGDPDYLIESSGDMAEVIRGNMELFRQRCEDEGIHHKIHFETGTPLKELLKETAFADLLITDAKATLDSDISEELNPSLKILLSQSHCPLVVVQPDTLPTVQVILTYDGISSMYAIKLFAYVLPELRTLPITLLSVIKDKGEKIPLEEQAHEWLQLHFPQLQQETLYGEPSLLVAYLKAKANSLVVTGAYGRGPVSRFFKPSLADDMIKQTACPLFIAHEK